MVFSCHPTLTELKRQDVKFKASLGFMINPSSNQGEVACVGSSQGQGLGKVLRDTYLTPTKYILTSFLSTLGRRTEQAREALKSIVGALKGNESLNRGQRTQAQSWSRCGPARH